MRLDVEPLHYSCNFIVRQLQEVYLAANKPLFATFVGVEKAFDRVP